MVQKLADSLQPLFAQAATRLVAAERHRHASVPEPFGLLHQRHPHPHVHCPPGHRIRDHAVAADVYANPCSASPVSDGALSDSAAAELSSRCRRWGTTRSAPCPRRPPYGWIKHALGFRHFSLRGLAKVRCEWDLVCLALNVKRLHVLMAA